jgi:hypothetical protein
MFTVGYWKRFVVVFALTASVGAAGLAACTGELRGEDAQMACCNAMGKDCPMRSTAADCCQTEGNSHQGGTLTGALASSKLLGGMASTALVHAPSDPEAVDSVQRVTTLARTDRHQPHSPPSHLRNLPLLI